jgi:hypothetical protein
LEMVPGDSVVLKTAVIDTTETSLTKVVIPEDLTLTVTAIPYETCAMARVES